MYLDTGDYIYIYIMNRRIDIYCFFNGGGVFIATVMMP